MTFTSNAHTTCLESDPTTALQHLSDTVHVHQQRIRFVLSTKILMNTIQIVFQHGIMKEFAYVFTIVSIAGFRNNSFDIKLKMNVSLFLVSYDSIIWWTLLIIVNNLHIISNPFIIYFTLHTHTHTDVNEKCYRLLSSDNQL